MGASLTASFDAVGNYTVAVDGKAWLKGQATMLRTAGAAFSTADGSLAPSGAVNTFSGTDASGDYTATQLTFMTKTSFQDHAAAGISMIATIRVYSTGVVVFEQHFPQGLIDCQSGDKDKVITAFPSFGAASGAPELGFLGYSGDMTGSQATDGIFGKDKLPDGIKGSGPVVLFTEDLSTSVVISSYSEFMANSQMSQDDASVSYGIMGNVTSVPAGYKIANVITLSPRGGVNNAMQAWGDVLLGAYGKTRDMQEQDYTLNWLGYSTDNGAYYYYQTEPNKTYETTLLDVKADAEQMDIPYQYVLLDSWWYFKDAHGDGVLNWTAMPSVFPHNLTWFTAETSWPIQGHNRFWSPNTNYAKQNGGPWEFGIDYAGGRALPMQQEFWDWLMAESRKWGLVVYEQDWLDDEFDKYDGLTQNVSLARQWLLQMGNAATANDVKIQYCMSHVRHIMQSIEIPAVSQSRASGDYSQDRSEQWKVGTTGILAQAVGIAPSKDNYWSTTFEPGNKWGSSAEPYHRLQSVVESLSTGPVTASDKVGLSNATLINRACMSNGRLLKPSRPATNLDAVFVQRAFGSGGLNGEVWTTGSGISGRWYSSVLSAELATAATLTPAMLGNGNYASTSTLVAFETNATEALIKVTADSPLQLSVSDRLTFQYFNIAPVVEGEFTLLGEPDKWIAVSAARFTSVSSIGGSSPSMEVVIAGQSGEVVNVNFLAPGGSEPVMVSCTVPQSSRTRILMPSKVCQAL